METTALKSTSATAGAASGVVIQYDEAQRLADALGTNKAAILQNHGLITVGSSQAGWFQFQPLYARIVAEQPDFLD